MSDDEFGELIENTRILFENESPDKKLWRELVAKVGFQVDWEHVPCEKLERIFAILNEPKKEAVG